MRQKFVMWWKIIKQYLQNSSIHGVKYLVDNQLSCAERLFWLIFCALSWYGCINMINDVLKNYIESRVALTTDTMYLDWEAPFPTVVFCITSSPAIGKFFKRNPGLFTNYSNTKFLRSSSEDLLSMYEKLRVPCNDLLAECTWNKMKFNCCAEFHELKKTGVGYCIAMNTFHLKDKQGEPSVHFFVNRTVQYGDLIIDLHLDAKIKKYLFAGFSVHIINNYQLPTFANVEKEETLIKAGRTSRIEFTMENTFNEDRVKHVAIKYRSCHFYYETQKNSLFDIYSSDSCYLEVIIEQMIKLCGCVNFYYSVPPGARACNATETLCIIANKANITSQALKDKYCLPNCEGTGLIVNRLEPQEYDAPNRTYARIHFSLLSHPTMRYRRYVTNDLLDVIGKSLQSTDIKQIELPVLEKLIKTPRQILVSIGSAFGLFMGASILSIFELLYWLFIRRDKIE